jgi:glycine cleavage system H protein
MSITIEHRQGRAPDRPGTEGASFVIACIGEAKLSGPRTLLGCSSGKSDDTEGANRLGGESLRYQTGDACRVGVRPPFFYPLPVRHKEVLMEFPTGLKYTENDEWIRVDGDIGTVGVTDFAQDQLSDIVFFEVFLEAGDSVDKGEAFGTLESVKAAADIYAPVSGQIAEINEELAEAPELVNTDPYGDAWMVKIAIADPADLDDLLDAEAYEKSTEEREH